MKPVIFYQPTTHLYNHLHFQSIGLFIFNEINIFILKT